MKALWIFRIMAVILLQLITTALLAQMMLVVEKPGSGKRYKYFCGEPVRLTVAGMDRPVEGIITSMTDTGLVINGNVVVHLKYIRVFHKKRYFVSILTPVAWTAGAGYFLIDVVNRTINNDSPVIPESTIKATVILGGIGALALPFRYTRYNIGEKWKIKILNLKDPQ